jgi:hypothetical protein
MRTIRDEEDIPLTKGKRRGEKRGGGDKRNKGKLKMKKKEEV